MPEPGGALVKCRIAAQAIGVKPVTIIKWIRRKRIDGIKHAGRWYVRRSALNALLASQSQMQT